MAGHHKQQAELNRNHKNKATDAHRQKALYPLVPKYSSNHTRDPSSLMLRCQAVVVFLIGKNKLPSLPRGTKSSSRDGMISTHDLPHTCLVGVCQLW